MPLLRPTDDEKIARFDKAFKVLYDLAFKAPEIRPPGEDTVELLGSIICNGNDPRVGQ